MVKDKCFGALVGLAVGDALGTPLEFKERDENPLLTEMIGGGCFRLNPGEWTDDTSMALCLADAILLSGDLVDQTILLNNFANWYQYGNNSHNGKCFDIGNTTMVGIREYLMHGTLEQKNDHLSSGNGSIMRLSPVAIRWFNNKKLAIENAVRQSKTTHGSELCSSASADMAEILVDAINGASIESIYGIKLNQLRKIPREMISSSGYVNDTLLAANWAVTTTSSFEEALIKAVNLADDSDTVGAVTGQIAGAIYGYSNIPSRWLNKLVWHQRIKNLAENLYNMAINDV